MKVLSIVMDRKLFEEGSSVLSRSKDYAEKMEELHVIVFSMKVNGLENKKIDNLYLYPTNSTSPLFYVFDAIKIGKKIIKINGMSRNNSVISTQDPFETGLVGYFLHRKFHLPLQLQVHTDFLSRYFANNILNKIRVIIANFIIPNAQSIRVVSSTISDSIKNKFPNIKAKIDVLPIFVDINSIINSYPGRDIKKDFPQFSKIILMASRLSKEKRIDIALLSFKKILSKVPNAGLIICGEGPEQRNLKNLASKLGLSENVVFLPWQSDLISYYKTTDVFLLTSEYEGYGMTLIEAGASGCPIVTTKVGIAKTDLFKNGENSYVCEVGDTESISNGIIEIVSDLSKRELFKREIQESMKKIAITKDQYTVKYVGLLEKLIKNV